MRVQLVILTVFNCLLCQAQTDSTYNKADLHNNIELSYLGSLIYPGISAGIEFPVSLGKIKTAKEQIKVKSFRREHFVSGNLSLYHHYGFHDNVFVTAEWIMRRTHNGGFFSEFSAGPGFSRTFLAGTTYRVDENGNISVIKLAGYSYALLSIGEGFGYNFSFKKHFPVSAYARMSLISMFPYNSTIYFRPVLEIGFRYNPGHIFVKKLKKPINPTSK